MINWLKEYKNDHPKTFYWMVAGGIMAIGVGMIPGGGLPGFFITYGAYATMAIFANIPF